MSQIDYSIEITPREMDIDQILYIVSNTMDMPMVILSYMYLLVYNAGVYQQYIANVHKK